MGSLQLLQHQSAHGCVFTMTIIADNIQQKSWFGVLLDFRLLLRSFCCCAVEDLTLYPDLCMELCTAHSWGEAGTESRGFSLQSGAVERENVIEMGCKT